MSEQNTDQKEIDILIRRDQQHREAVYKIIKAAHDLVGGDMERCHNLLSIAAGLAAREYTEFWEPKN